MEYKGQLYGKVGGITVPLQATTEDVSELKELLRETTTKLAMLRRSMTAHPDCEEGSEFDDFTSTAAVQEAKVNIFLNKTKL